MAFFVNVIGPEFLWEENVRAFLRIEAAARQYSSHSGESIYLIRRPFKLADGHFVLLWPRGAALVGMYPYGGTIRGGRVGPWHGNRVESSGEPIDVGFDNPYRSLSAIALELEALIEGLPIELEISEKSGNDAGKIETPDTHIHVPSIAIFTGPVREISLREPIQDAAFSAMTIDYAITRTAVHIPNIFRAADMGEQIYSPTELAAISEMLDRSTQFHETSEEKYEVESTNDTSLYETPSASHRRPSYFILHAPSLWKWLVPVIIAAIVTLFFAIKSFVKQSPALKVDTLQNVQSYSPGQGKIIIELPVEAELFISADAYRTRSDLDHALALGLGQRYLPDTIQEMVMDSFLLAKGVYGYFKVDNVWRKGKLLETFQPFDTIRIVKFLDPLL